jgi:HEAT repeat protein
MSKCRFLFATAAACAIFALPALSHAQQYGGEGLGSATSSNAMMHQGITKAGIDDITARAEHESEFKIVKDVKLGLKDADPNVRVAELNKLRNVQDPDADRLLITSLSDPDIRVKMKAIDLLGARESNIAVEPLSQLLFLRSTADIVKLHAVAALGRIGDARGALPVMQYLEEQSDNTARGTAVFALGEIGNDKATQLLVSTADEDKSPMVRRLAKEALQKIDGELPTQHSAELASRKSEGPIPTDQKLAKIRAIDQKIQDQQR